MRVYHCFSAAAAGVAAAVVAAAEQQQEEGEEESGCQKSTMALSLPLAITTVTVRIKTDKDHYFNPYARVIFRWKQILHCNR